MTTAQMIIAILVIAGHVLGIILMIIKIRKELSEEKKDK